MQSKNNFAPRRNPNLARYSRIQRTSTLFPSISKPNSNNGGAQTEFSHAIGSSPNDWAAAPSGPPVGNEAWSCSVAFTLKSNAKCSNRRSCKKPNLKRVHSTIQSPTACTGCKLPAFVAQKTTARRLASAFKFAGNFIVVSNDFPTTFPGAVSNFSTTKSCFKVRPPFSPACTFKLIPKPNSAPEKLTFSVTFISSGSKLTLQPSTPLEVAESVPTFSFRAIGSASR
jgi:hypothetical protein